MTGRPWACSSGPSFWSAPRAANAAPAAAVAVAPPAVTPSLPKFDRAIALERDLLDAMLVMVERRSPDLKTALVEARAGRYDAAAREAFNSGDLIVGAFMSGVDLFSKGELDEAAAQLQAAAGPRREFFPAAFFLGACYAAVGRDQDAAGVWQLALGKDPRPPVAYTVAADARLRIGQSQSAIDILKPAYDRDPTQDEIARRLAMAYAMTNRHAEALTVLDEYLLRRPDRSGHALCRHRVAVRSRAWRPDPVEHRAGQGSRVCRSVSGAKPNARGQVPRDDEIGGYCGRLARSVAITRVTCPAGI